MNEQLNNKVLSIQLPLAGLLFIDSVLKRYEKEILQDCMNQSGIEGMNGANLSIKIVRLSIMKSIVESGIKGAEVQELVDEHKKKSEEHIKRTNN